MQASMHPRKTTRFLLQKGRTYSDDEAPISDRAPEMGGLGTNWAVEEFGESCHGHGEEAGEASPLRREGFFVLKTMKEGGICRRGEAQSQSYLY